MYKSCMSIVRFKQDNFVRLTRNLCTTMTNLDKKEHLEHTANRTRIPDLLDCKITRIEDISPTVKALSVQANNPNKISFKAGQWVDFFIPGENQVGGFSMWNHPAQFQQTNIIELAVKESKWPPAHWVHNKCKKDDNVQVRFGGDFYYPPDSLKEPHNILLIGGGVGINPLLSIWLQARHLHTSNDPLKPDKVSLLYSAVNKDELIFSDVIDSTTNSNSAFKSTYFTTRSNHDNCINGRIDFEQVKSSLEDMNVNNGRTLIYLCGPPNMIRDMLRSLGSLQVKRGDVFYELWY